MDSAAIADKITDPQAQALYDAQMATATFVSCLCGGFLGLIAVVTLAFYINLYIRRNAYALGLFKALGYPNARIACAFWVFGLSVLLGAALGFGCGYAFAPAVYDALTIGALPGIEVSFHPELLVLLVILPAVVFSALAVACAFFALRRPALELMRGKGERVKAVKRVRADRERGFLAEVFIKTTFGRKGIAFFVAFACFCFSAMVQMGASTLELDTGYMMGAIMLIIGVVLAVTVLIMATTTLVNSNAKNVAMMKTFGYNTRECVFAVLGGFHIYALIGFAVGTAYQYGLMTLMVNIVFKDVAMMPDYSFNAPVMLITFAAFIVFYEACTFAFGYALSKVPLKAVMLEN
jgi:predicted lysophospholipase L1 biosynthesis ABC-type transport system permease subunit